MNRATEIIVVVVVLDYALIGVYGVWLIPSAWRRRRTAGADLKRAQEAVAGGTLAIPESYRRQFAAMAAAVEDSRTPEYREFCVRTADRLRQLTGLPDSALALILADIVRIAQDVDQMGMVTGVNPHSALCGVLLGVATDLSSLERDLSAQ